MSTEEIKNLSEDDELPEDAGGESNQDKNNGSGRRRVRVKVRKKIRIKQKPSTKKAIRKIAEKAFWVIIIVGFVASLIIMIVELDVRDEKFKQQRKKATPAKGQ